MKYDQRFTDAVAAYKKQLAGIRGSSVFITFSKDNKQAFFSLAPLSRALHELECSLSVIGHGEEKDQITVLRELWAVWENKKPSEKFIVLNDFITEVQKKIPDFGELFKRPVAFEATGNAFIGPVKLNFVDWVTEYRTEELNETAKVLFRDVYNIKPDERVGIGFELISTQDLLGHPLEDYLDSYQIIWAMTTQCPGKAAMNASSSRGSMLEKANPVTDLRATLLGLELDKEVDEEPFMSFKKVSEVFGMSRIRPVDATFAVHGKGYPGKHVFGDVIGYPSLNKKTKWKSPGQMVYKLDFYPQTKLEDRDPLARIAFTETLPIDVFIETNLVDWDEVRRRNQVIKDVLDKCDKVFVKGKLDEKHVTDLEVGLVKPDGTHRWVRRSDTDVREKLNQEYLTRTGIRAGCMGNIPGGEAFVTPEYVKGVFVGDVVIAIDQSYPLSKEDPFVVKMSGNEYEIVSAPKKILDKFNEKKDEAWKLLIEAEKHQSLPQDIVDMKKRNFNNIGEFAINTNPEAKLCDYLIVNEKIAKMMHIALGSGYEDDRSTDYHIDIVFDAPRQKLDVFGVGKDGEHWILKDGEFVI